MGSTTTQVNVVGVQQKGAGYSNTIGCNHTVSISVVNFIGRIYIQGSLASQPGPNDWFSIPLVGDTPFVQFPLNPSAPTGSGNGDTISVSYSFSGNYIWIRAICDRTYLVPPPTDPSLVGAVRQILLNYGAVSPAATGGSNNTNTSALNGIPSGGASGQILAKNSDANYDVVWRDENHVFVTNVAPTGTSTGTLWWNDDDGTMYINYQQAWVQSSPQLPGPIGPQGPIGPTGPQGLAGPTGPIGAQEFTFTVFYSSSGEISSMTGLPGGWTGSTGPNFVIINYTVPGIPRNWVAYGQVAPNGTVFTSRGPTALMNITYDTSIPGQFVLNNITANNVGTVYGGKAIFTVRIN
jgi:hypothetical protein